MIPKKIHYCWFGRNPKPKLARKCIKSWEKKCPDYEIIEWNEDNYDLSSAPIYVQQAYEMKKWAFVTDYVRLHVVYEHGGIYLDTDVELIKTLDSLLNNKAYFGFEKPQTVNTGLMLGAEPKHPFLKELMRDYEVISFIRQDGTLDLETCTDRNTRVFLRNGLIPNGTEQLLQCGVKVYPTDYFRPYNDWTGILELTKNTVSIHWYNASWQTEQYMREKKEAVSNHKKYRLARKVEWLRFLPNRMFRSLLGDKRYELIKKIIRK